MNALACPVCKAATTSSEACTSCGAQLISCPECGGLNPVARQVCLICGEKLANNVPLHAATAANSPRKVVEPFAAAEVRVSSPRPSSEANKVQSDIRSASIASGKGPAFSPRKGMIAGVARGCQVRQEALSEKTTCQILAFRLDRFDDEGRPLPSVPVEMRGLHLQGQISDGEWVEVPGNWQAGELFTPRRIRNLTTGTWVKVTGTGVRVLQFLFFIVFISVVAFLFWKFFQSSQNEFNDFTRRHQF
jgi:hypothetical protein